MKITLLEKIHSNKFRDFRSWSLLEEKNYGSFSTFAKFSANFVSTVNSKHRVFSQKFRDFNPNIRVFRILQNLNTSIAVFKFLNTSIYYILVLNSIHRKYKKPTVRTLFVIYIHVSSSLLHNSLFIFLENQKSLTKKGQTSKVKLNKGRVVLWCKKNKFCAPKF
jgi:hypothetical protein